MDSGPKRGVVMKVLISADMEGTAGIVDRAHTAIPDRAATTGSNTTPGSTIGPAV